VQAAAHVKRNSSDSQHLPPHRGCQHSGVVDWLVGLSGVAAGFQRVARVTGRVGFPQGMGLPWLNRGVGVPQRSAPDMAVAVAERAGSLAVLNPPSVDFQLWLLVGCTSALED
jgi:hypothetical protein